MANTFSQIYVQVIFAVKGRQNLIHRTFKDELYKFIAGIVRNNDQKLLAINGMPDHLHVFLSLNPDICLSDLVRDIKANSSRFINERKWISGKFRWQEGFGAFSYSKSQSRNVIQYILNQEKHHTKKTFKEEYLDFLDKFEIKYDNRYVFEWIEN